MAVRQPGGEPSPGTGSACTSGPFRPPEPWEINPQISSPSSLVPVGSTRICSCPAGSLAGTVAIILCVLSQTQYGPYGSIRHSVYGVVFQTQILSRKFPCRTLRYFPFPRHSFQSPYYVRCGLVCRSRFTCCPTTLTARTPHAGLLTALGELLTVLHQRRDTHFQFPESFPPLPLFCPACPSSAGSRTKFYFLRAALPGFPGLVRTPGQCSHSALCLSFVAHTIIARKY